MAISNHIVILSAYIAYFLGMTALAIELGPAFGIAKLVILGLVVAPCIIMVKRRRHRRYAVPDGRRQRRRRRRQQQQQRREEQRRRGPRQHDEDEEAVGVREEISNTWTRFSPKKLKESVDAIDVEMGNVGTADDPTDKGEHTDMECVDLEGPCGVEDEDEDEDDLECPICFGEYEPGEIAIRLPCRHTFHEKCLLIWTSKNARCPYCNQNLNNEVKRKLTTDTEIIRVETELTMVLSDNSSPR